ncbi:MAG: glycogen debranching enzyme GlgX, partial [Rhodospirillaceae bacterium]|nr:glycogen debranching enzyme GlgX [Rhodospirillaceae bacterium]
LGRPSASINYVASHDGRPLNDIVTYAHRHNESNGEDNRDGNANEIAWNCGVEGPTTDETICLLRERQKRNLVATLILSHGVPMMLSGDELGHSQFGNNNAYCQDNDVSWLDWSRLREDGRFLDFVRRILALRASTHAFARDLFFTGDALQGEAKDLAWLRPDGREMTTEDWREPNQQCLGCLLSDHGHSLLIALNASREIVPFVLPPDRLWRIVLDTWSDAPGDVASGAHDLPPQSMCVFRDAAL